MSALSASKSGARSARGPKRIDLSGYGAPLSARGTSSDRGPASKMQTLPSTTLTPAPSVKRKPSEIVAAARQAGGLMTLERQDLATTRIISFQDMNDFTHQVDSVVPMDEPLFKASPSEIRFANFESLQNLDATLNLRNQDNVARRVKILQPDSTFFKVLPGKGRKADAGDNKVAPGMEVSYIVRFTPDQQVEDYSYDLVVITERERFLVPIRATGGGALLDMPDELDFGLSPVKYEAPKTIMVRNVGEKPTKFLLKVPPPFSTSIQDGYLEVGEIMQVDVVFRPDKAEPYEREMVVIYGDGIEAYVSLRGRAENVNVTFSASQLQLEDTFIALSTQKTIVIHNNSEIPVDFSWRAFPSIQEEISQKLKLQVQLKQEEQDEASAIQELHSAGESEAESVLSDTSEEYDTRCTSLKGIEMAQGALQRRYKNITKAILEDPMFFYDEIFAVEPLSGRIWAKSKIAITFTFTPKAALNYQCLAYCSVVGRAERLPLLLKGTGIGPKAAFSYDELDVGDIFVESVHQYEVNLINQGDIDVEFRLVPNSSPFGSIFSFMPSDGRLEVGGECTIVVEVCPDLLGEFQETFYWELIGSTSKIGLSFRGHSVSPTFHFDLDRISFGVVSYGFLNSKTLTLTNTSEVPMRFALRIPGDGRFTQREFDVIPPKGTLLPNCAQKVQIDFVSSALSDLTSLQMLWLVERAVLARSDVSEELASIPIQARCAVPQVALEPAEHVDYGDIFIRYPSHQTMVLNNTSALPAKFQIMPQEETTRAIAEFEPDQSFGSVPPASSHVLTFTLTSQVIGTLQIPITIRILGQSSARNLILIANTIGPIVNVEPSVVDWGNSHCLEPITRSVLVTNNSVIPASIRCIMKSKNSLWTLSPKAMELPPHGSANLNMTLTIDEVAKMTDTVHVIVHESNDVAVTVRAKGIGTPVMCREPLEVIDFGTQYTTQTHSKEFVIENRGRQPRKLVWTLESTEAKRKERKLEEGETSVFSVVPDTLLLDGKCAFRFVFNASSPKPGSLVDTLTCNELCGDDRKGKVIFRSELSGNFVLPLLELSATSVCFRYLWERNCPLHPLSEPLVLKNVSPLEVRFFIKVQPPFYVNVDTVFLRPDENVEIRVEFDPAFKVDRVCGTVKQKLSIVYQDHPQRDHVGLIGEVIFPNLTLSTNKLDFGSVLNETTKQLTVTMGNPNPLPVNYQWSFVEEADLNDEDYTRALQSTALQSPTTTGLAGATMSPGNSHTSGFGHKQTPSAPPSETIEHFEKRTSVVSHAPTTKSRRPVVDINQIFDILPIMGILEPGCTQDITFTYFGMKNQKFDVAAVCQTEGGPEYEVALKGQASKLDFVLDKTELDFGEVPYTEVQEREVLLVNTGKVAFQYSWNLCALSRPSVLDCWPIAGEIKAGDKERITIRFRAGIPEEVSEVALLEVAHFERQRIHVRGHGIFPGILLMQGGGGRGDHGFKGLERWEEEAHQTNKELALQRLLTNGPPPLAACVSNSTNSSMQISVQSGQEVSTSEQWQPEPQLIEFEVDRHYICQTLLSQEKDLWQKHLEKYAGKEPTFQKSGRGSARNKADWRPMLELPPVTAAQYCCNFGHIVLGHSGKKVISVYNCFHENVNFNISRKVLMQYGFQISPEKVSKVLPGKKVKLELTCFRDRSGEEGKQETTWIIPVRGGPFYEVKLVSEFVRPDLELSSDSIDFGHVPVGQVKRITIKLRNVKPVVVSWDYRVPTDKFGKPLECAYVLQPRAGRIAPGDIQFVTVSFTPTAASYFNQKLALRIMDNPNRKQLHMRGHGDGLRVDVEPSSFRLGPVLPGTENCIQELFLCNPTEYTIEVYSTDFDSKYKEEEYFLQVYDQYENDRMELPLRPPGAPTWPKVAKHGRKVRREELIRQREIKVQQRVEARQQAAERVEMAKKLAEVADEEAQEKANADLKEAEAALAEIDALPEEEPVEEESVDEVGEVEEDMQPEMDPADFPYRVLDEDRLHAVLIGPACSGKSSLTRHCGREGRKVITVEEAVDWALSGPASLQSPEEEDRRARLRQLMTTAEEQHEQAEKDREKQAQKAKEQFVPRPVQYSLPLEDVVHFLQARLRLPDCNACVAFDNIQSKYASTEQTATAIFSALWPERVVVLGLGCSIYGDAFVLGEGKLPALPQEEGTDGTEPAVDEVGNLRAYYAALKVALQSRPEKLEALLTPAQEAADAAQAELQEIATKLSELEARMKQKAEEAEAAGAKAAAEATEATAGILVESAAALEDFEAAEEAELRDVRDSLKSAEEKANAAQAHVQEIQGQLDSCLASTQHLEKCEGSEEALTEKVHDMVSAVEAAAAAVLEAHRPKATEATEAEEGAEAPKTEADGTGKEGQATEGTEEEAKVEPTKKAEEELPQVTSSVHFIPLLLETSFEAGMPEDDFPTMRAAFADALPPPLIPKEPPIPPPSLAQVVEHPPVRLPRPSVPHFQLQTPRDEAPEEGKEGTEIEQPTRWLIEPHGRVRLLMKFFSEDKFGRQSEIGKYQTSLGFEVVGGIYGNAPVSIDVEGITAFPGISSDPRNVFMRRVKTKPASGYASKQYVASSGIFEFGPLLVGRSPDAKDEASEPYLKQHIENFRITNNSFLKADVAFSLASAAKVPDDPKAKAKAAPAPSLEEFPFTIEPKQLELEVGETKELSVSCFPVKEGTYSDTIVATITDNPDAVEFAIAAIGALPKVSVDNTELDFDRLLVKQRAAQTLKVSNVSAVPVKWQFEATPSVPEGFEVTTMEGVLAVGEEKLISVIFKSETACVHKFKLTLQISDVEGLRSWENAAELNVQAEAFVVDVVPQFPEEATGLDFGDVRVGELVEKSFQVANNGKYPVKFQLHIRRKSVRELVQIDYGVPLEEGQLPELQPGQKLPIKATASAPVAIQFPEPKKQGRRRNEELELLVYDTKTGDRVQVETPLIPLILRAVYNSFSLIPADGLNFGPVKIGESGTRELEICNDGPFKFDWFIFDAEGGVKKPETADFVLGDFKLSPGAGSLAPKETAKVIGTFTATEPKNWHHQIGIHVPGLQEDASDSIDLRDGDTGYKEYLLSAQSATPGIDAGNVHSIFEEHYVAPTLEDAVAFAGRLAIRAFDEEARYFSFGPLPVQGQSSDPPDPARFRITNPNPIACDVKFEIKPTAVVGKDAPVLPFELSSKELHIPPHEYRYIKVRFTPQALQRYSAIFEATVPEGKDPKTNILKFEIRGDGAMPSIALSGPTIFGDSGGQYDFGRGRIGKRQSVEFTLYNQGDIPAAARFELSQSPHFTLSCPRRITLEPKASQKFQVFFSPTELGDLSSSLQLQTAQNPYEDARVTFVGQGYKEEVSWELPEVAADEEDVLDLGEVCAWVVSFHINNSTAHTLRFQFPDSLPPPLEGIKIVPSIGHVLPGMKKQISFTYEPPASMKADVSIPVQIASIVPEEEEDWDNAWHLKAADTQDADEVDPEPPHTVVDGSAREMPLRTLAVADEMSYECGVERIYFSATVLFQSRLYRFTVSNPSSIALPYNWRVVPMEERERTGLLPYSITPPKGTIAAGASAEFEIRFAPKEVEDFSAVLDAQLHQLGAPANPFKWFSFAALVPL
ncbi:unnamed protein product [Durusdinium trenchii]|uniref:Hydrocephalus-inducing protein n=2 Tax=Durusdinium trenchii TaxID=1381693 RepID=A0ABP0HIP8_9DINO